MNKLDQVLPFGLTADSLLVILVASMAFFTVLAVWYALLERHPMEARAKMLAARRDELRGQALKERMPRKRQKESLGWMRQVVDTLKLMQSQQTDKLHDRLAQAGLRSRDAIIVFLFFKVAMPVLMGAVAFLLVYLLQIGDLSTMGRLVAVLGGIAFGFFAPELYVGNQIGKRQLALSRALPDGLDLLVICAESGLSLDAALERVANELGGASPAAGRGALPHLDRARFPARSSPGADQSQPAHQSALDPWRREHPAADRKIRHAAVPVAARPGQRVPRPTDAQGRGEGSPPAGDPDRADDRVHPADAVHRADRTGHHQRDGHAARPQLITRPRTGGQTDQSVDREVRLHRASACRNGRQGHTHRRRIVRLRSAAHRGSGPP